MATSLRSAGVRVTETQLRAVAASVIELDDAPDEAGAAPSSVG
jgi:hypothetical protein